MKRVIAFALAVTLAASLSACADENEKAYKSAVKLYNAEKYTEAKAAFQQLGDYEDSTIRVQKCDYEMATALFLKGDYAGAQAALEKLNGFKNSAELAQTCSYLLAQEAMLQGRYEEAAQRLAALEGYMGSEALAEELSRKQLSSVAQGTWTAAAGDLTQKVSEALNSYEMPVPAVTEPAEEEKEESEETEGSEEAEEEETTEAVPEKLDLVGSLTLEPMGLAVKLELLPSGAFVMDLEGGAEAVRQNAIAEVRKQLLRAAETKIAALADEADMLLQEYIQSRNAATVEEYLKIVYGIDLNGMISQCVEAPVRQMTEALPTYGAYRLENGNVILAVGEQETTAGLDAAAGKLALNVPGLGDLEFAKN